MVKSPADVRRARLSAHKLLASDFCTAADVVAWSGAVQAQDFPGARWAIGLRAAVTDADVLRAYDDGAILRTHVLRPTWHFVTDGDIRWLLALTGPRVTTRLQPRRRYLELDARTIARGRATLERALEGGASFTRAEVAAVFRRSRMQVTPERLTHLLVAAELDGVICSGPLRGAQHTYALLDERVPPAAPVDRDDAIARLAQRYFRSHGPATAADFAWWSGLPMRDARVGLASAGQGAPLALKRSRKPGAWLLPAFDEYLVAYKDRSAILAPHVVDPRDVLAPTVIADGRAVGNWRQRRERDGVTIDVRLRGRVALDEERAIERSAQRYGAFLERDVRLVPLGERPLAPPAAETSRQAAARGWRAGSTR